MAAAALCRSKPFPQSIYHTNRLDSERHRLLLRRRHDDREARREEGRHNVQREVPPAHRAEVGGQHREESARLTTLVPGMHGEEVVS